MTASGAAEQSHAISIVAELIRPTLSNAATQHSADVDARGRSKTNALRFGTSSVACARGRTCWSPVAGDVHSIVK